MDNLDNRGSYCTARDDPFGTRMGHSPIVLRSSDS